MTYENEIDALNGKIQARIEEIVISMNYKYIPSRLISIRSPLKRLTMISGLVHHAASMQSDIEIIRLRTEMFQAQQLLTRANQIIASTPYGKQWRIDYKQFKTKQNDNSRV